MLVVGSQVRPEFAATPLIERVTSPEQTLHNWATHTWGSMERMIEPNMGLPADVILRTSDGNITRSWSTSLTNMGALVWSSVSALDLNIIDRKKAAATVGKLLDTYQHLEKEPSSQMPFNWYDLTTGQKTVEWRDPNGSSEKRVPFISAVDWGWWAHALVLAQKVFPEFHEAAQRFIDEMDVSPIYDRDKNLFHGGAYVNSHVDPTTWYVDVLNHEGRIAVDMAVMLGKIPREALFQLGRVRPQVGKKVYREPPTPDITLTYSGSHLESLAVPIFIDEPEFLETYTDGKISAPNHGAAVRYAIDYARTHLDGKFAQTPCLDNDGVYREHGFPDLAMGRGYPASTVEALHGYYLTYPFAPDESQMALQRIYDHPGAFEEGLGFTSSVDTSNPLQSVAPGRLAVEQGFILAQSDNILNNNKMRNYMQF